MEEKSTAQQHDRNVDETRPGSSQGVMLVTISLLVSALLLTGVLLIHAAEEGGTELPVPGFRFPEISPRLPRLPLRRAEKETPEKAAEAAPRATEHNGLLGFPSRDKNRVRWPRLKLSGFGKPSGASAGFAIINGRRVFVGGNISGVTVVEIRDQGVLVEYRGKRKTLMMNTKIR